MEPKAFMSHTYVRKRHGQAFQLTFERAPLTTYQFSTAVWTP